jgi:hypothetical protein
MSESDLGPELIRQGGERRMLAPSAQASAAVKRQHRRIRALMALTIGLWIVAGLMIPAVLLPAGAKLKRLQEFLPASPMTADQLADALRRVLMELWIVAFVVIGISTIAALLAAICTIWLVLAVRRVTLAQISENLAGISDQLARLEGRSSSRPRSAVD